MSKKRVLNEMMGGELPEDTTPEEYAKAYPKVMKEMGRLLDGVKRDLNTLKGDNRNPRRAWVVALNMGFWGSRFAEILGDQNVARAFKAAQEAARKEAAKFPED